MKISDLINISESFDSKFENINWSRTGTVILGNGIINSNEFILEIGLQSVTLLQQYRYVTVEFYKIVDGIPSQSLTGNNSSQSKIFGCIKNAFYEKILELDNQYGVDGIVTLIRTDYANKPLKRLGLYKQMFSKIQGNTTWGWIHDFKFNSLLGSIFTKHHITADQLQILKSEIIGRGKENL